MLRSLLDQPVHSEFRELIQSFSDNLGKISEPQVRFRTVDLLTRILLDPVALACDTPQAMMDHLNKFVIPSPKYGFDSVLTATNATMSILGDKVALIASTRQVVVDNDHIGSGEKLLEAAFAVAVRETLDFRYTVSFDQDTRERDVIDADPFKQEEHSPGSSYKKYCEILGEQDEEVTWVRAHVDDYTDPQTGEVSLEPNLVLEGVDDADLVSLAVQAKNRSMKLKIVLPRSAFKRNRSLALLANVPHVHEGETVLFDYGSKNVGTLSAGPENEKALRSVADKFLDMIQKDQLVINKKKLERLGKNISPSGANTFQATSAPKANSYVSAIPKQSKNYGNLPPLTSNAERILLRILQRGRDARSVLTEEGLDPASMTEQEKEHHYSGLLSSSNTLPPSLKAQLKKVVVDPSYLTQSFQVSVQKMVHEAKVACAKINQLKSEPNYESVVLYHLARSPRVHLYELGCGQTAEGQPKPSGF